MVTEGIGQTPARASSGPGGLGLSALALYVFLFGAFFAGYPATGTLPGNCDTWLAIALSETYVDEMARGVGDHSIGRAMFPLEDVHAYGEASPLAASIYLLPRLLLGMQPVTAYWILLTTLFASTAFAGFLLARALTGNAVAATAGGFMLACSNLLFAHIDDPIIVALALPCLAWWSLEEGMRSESRRRLLAAGALGGAQVLISVYVFAYQSLLLGLVLLLRRPWRTTTVGRRNVAAAALVYVAVATPSFIYYSAAADQEMVEPSTEERRASYRYLALQPSDWFAPLPNNLIYDSRPLAPESFAFWGGQRKRAFFGYAILLLAIVGLVRARRDRALLGSVIAVGLLLGWGGTQLGSIRIEPIGWYLYQLHPLLGFLRIAGRAHLLVGLACAVAATHGIAAIMEVTQRRHLSYGIVAAIAVLHAAENVPLPMPRFAAAQYQRVPTAYVAAFAGRASPATVFDLPSHSGYDLRGAGAALFPYNREIIYMLWQTQHHQNVVNGVNGYFSPLRLELDDLATRITDTDSLARLRQLGVTHLVYHPELVLDAEEELSTLALPGLRLMHRDASVWIAELVEPEAEVEAEP